MAKKKKAPKPAARRKAQAKRKRRTRRPVDFNQLAKWIVDKTTGQKE